MRWELTLVAAPEVSWFDAVELSVELPDGASGAQLAVALRSTVDAVADVTVFTIAGLPLDDLAAGTAPLTNGAVVVAGGAPPPEPGPSLVLAVHTGPDAGRCAPLKRGTYSIGRGSVDIPLADPQLARHHATLAVEPAGIVLTATTAQAGFSVDGAWATRLRIDTGQELKLGGSGCRLVVPGQAALAAGPDDDAPLVLRHPGSNARTQWTAAAMAALPLGVGLALAVLTRQWMFLAFAGMGAATALVPLAAGRRQRQRHRAELADAARRDAARRLRRWRSAAELALGSNVDGAGVRTAARTGPVRLRLGSCLLPANIALEPPDPGFTAPSLDGMPLVCSVPLEGMDIHGPGPAVAGMLRFVLMQLAAEGVPTVLCGSPDPLLLSARFLGCLRTTASAAGLAAEVAGCPPAVVVVAGPQAEFDPVLQAMARSGAGPAVIRALPTGPAAAGAPAAVALSFSGGLLRGAWAGAQFAPDLVGAEVFDRYARQAGGAGGPIGTGAARGRTGVPDFCVLPEPANATPEAVVRRWHETSDGPLAPVPLGRSAAGAETVDLGADGPHLLVAGTTGSGKSELLRTLAAGLALAHSPADLSFLFLDFKGGAALGPLCGFPHASSLVTDMAGAGMGRTLASLRAEIRRREATLARAGAADVDVYRRTAGGGPATAPLAHLVVIIDEFRVLVDQFPDAMKELMRIAAVGRSLGIHLVMATQRPQGAVSADIRANVSTAICLRVQSTYDSQDVIDGPAAAAVSAALPGRAFLRRSGEAPVEFQTAALSVPPPEHAAQVMVSEAAAALLAGPARGPGPASAASDVDAVAALLAAAQRLARHRPPAPVVAPELPQRLDAQSLAVALAAAVAGGGDGLATGVGVHAGPGPAAVLGLLDAPSRQRVDLLGWAPGVDSHLALLGQAGSGCASALAATAQAVAGLPGGAVLYCLDGDGSLSALRGHPRVGAHLGPGELRAAARLLQRLNDTATAPPPTIRPPVEPEQSTAAAGGQTLVLCISAWGRWAAALRGSPWPWCEDLIGELCAPGRALRVVVLASGGRELHSARFFGAILHRLYFPAGASVESMSMWPRLPEMEPVPGRAALFGPLAVRHGAGESTGLAAQLVHRTRTAGPCPAGQDGLQEGAVVELPLRIAALPGVVGVAEVLDACGGKEGLPPRQRLLLGLGGDGGDPIRVALEPGTVLPVLGAPGSGKSSVLEALEQLNPDMHFSRLQPPAVPLDADRAGGASGPRPAVVLADDLDRCPPVLLQAVQRELDAGAMVVATLAPNISRIMSLPLPGLRTPARGIVLAPSRPQDGELFGARLDTLGGEPPGRAVLVEAGTAHWYQSPTPAAAAAGVHSSAADASAAREQEARHRSSE
ncbi:FtsK/SpoIIIE domain-containing protein [Arthrobacter sp. 35W]|uniref:FtsK/SpoIIIE domain-containing protein n=1 Tax=Arthrobacter sp. 35W TaxID=1132441 RepID=UPI0003FE1F00|nr:FtsK/SpoIIIE domain-containing protein [Arthrobacter sp. 35W]